MSATNGSTRARTRGRLFGLALAMVLALSAVLASTAGATPPVKETYLSIGDSLAFGWSQQQANEQEKNGEPAAAFNRGYSNFYFNHLMPAKNGVQLQNLGCPGETSKGLIGLAPSEGGTNPIAEALKPSGGGEAPCAYHNVKGLELHKEYGGTKSQLEAALETIAVDKALGTPVTHLTFEIGANDELHVVGKCKAEVAAEYAEIQKGEKTQSQYEKNPGEGPEVAFKGCLSAHVPALFKSIVENAGKALGTIRQGSKVGGVDYLGPIIFQAGYDPFGRECGATEEPCRSILKMKPGQQELLEGSNALVEVLTQQEEANLKAPLGLCFANPQETWNTGVERTEVPRLHAYVNEANFTFTEGKFNGGDIHPTELGYKKLNTVMVKACG